MEDEIKYNESLIELRKLRKFQSGTVEHEKANDLREFILRHEKKYYPLGENNYEKWSDKMQDENYFIERMKLIEKAEKIVQLKQEFVNQRKEAIKNKLKQKQQKQKYLTELLNVNKSYVSQLLNGKKRFSTYIISVLHHKLEIPYNLLIPEPELLQSFETENSVSV